jgi:rubrerythrin
MNFEQSKTKNNLMTAFLRESGAALEYGFYAEQAKTDGYQDIANVFNKFAGNERAHAKVWFKLFHSIADTEGNLKDSMDLEHYERSVLYSEFSKVAEEEGFSDIAKLFDGVSAIERQHEEVYKTLYEKVKNDQVFSSETEVWWQCLNCGHIHKGLEPTETCPVCSHPQAYFTLSQNQGQN